MLKVSDLCSGLAIAGLGLAIFARAQSFVSVGASPISPSFYPGLVGLVLTACGLGLAISAIRRGDVRPLATVPAWMARPGNIVAVLSVPVAIVAYGLASPALGFLATSVLVMFGLLLAFRVSVLWSVAVALILPALLHLIFVVLMRVPLPSGIVEGWLR
ncbi:tripartite tricarboxylate transporter TctB family protein [Acuticoccus sp. M5D2P5]|uniref:tripartite tricarboxylate transporter TctB family protein n=1 Tax=Acuticoccus kalidii TaxID=2910977 RepID=UPI001F3B69DF|nr:tripartite tricarboxylate transporter TctB family protein [Acuticoccus kalidii]MCF3934919.1 tripartite tricarboxylate transporter TctB family protein [Acuticoccus kalidii]